MSEEHTSAVLETEDENYELPEESAPVVTLPAVVEDVPERTVLDAYERFVESLSPMDEAKLVASSAFIEVCKNSAKNLDAKRKALVDPLNKQVDAYNEHFQPFIKGFLAVGKKAAEIVGKFLADKKAEDEARQREAAAEAARKQAELDRKAREAEEAAKQALAKGDLVTAAKLENKAEQYVQKAAAVVPVVVPTTSTKIDLGDATLSFADPKNTWGLPGWDKKKSLPLMSPLLASLVGDISQLPPGVQFLLRHADLNPVHLNASFKVPGAKFPKPFTTVPVYGSNRLA